MFAVIVPAAGSGVPWGSAELAVLLACGLVAAGLWLSCQAIGRRATRN